MLAEVAKRHAHVHVVLDGLVRRLPGAVIAAGDTALARVAAVVTPETLETVEAALPPDTDKLRLSVAVITQRLTPRRLATAGSDNSRRAGIHRALAVAQMRAGLPFEAAMQRQYEIGYLQTLSTGDPATWKSSIKEALDVISQCVMDVQSLELSHRLAEASVAYFARLPRSDTEHRAEYARALNVLGMLQMKVRGAAVAVATLKEAVDTYRALEQSAPGTRTLQFAAALTNLSSALSATDQAIPAVETSREAIALYHTALSKADDSQEAFAAALEQHATRLEAAARNDGVGEPVQVRTAMDQAVAIYRRLHSEDPQRYDGALREALIRQARAQSRAGDRSAAVEALEEALVMQYQRWRAPIPQQLYDRVYRRVSDRSAEEQD